MTRVVRGLAATPRVLADLAGGGSVAEAMIDASFGGVARSFLWPLAGLLFILASSAPLTAAVAALAPATAGAEAATPTAQAGWATALGHLLYTAAFPAALAALTSRLGGGAGYGAFLVLFNGMRFWLAGAYAVLGLAAAAGLPPAAVAAGWVTLAGGSLFLIWRIARETLTGEVGFSLAVVLLALGCDAGSDYAAGWLAGLFG